jgi:hypothetical protein
VIWINAVTHPRRFELFLLNETKNLAPNPRFHPSLRPIQTKNRLTRLPSGSFLEHAPQEICFELDDIKTVAFVK